MGLALSISSVTDALLSRNEETRGYCHVADKALTVLENESTKLNQLLNLTY